MADSNFFPPAKEKLLGSNQRRTIPANPKEGDIIIDLLVEGYVLTALTKGSYKSYLGLPARIEQVLLPTKRRFTVEPEDLKKVAADSVVIPILAEKTVEDGQNIRVTPLAPFDPSIVVALYALAEWFGKKTQPNTQEERKALGAAPINPATLMLPFLSRLILQLTVIEQIGGDEPTLDTDYANRVWNLLIWTQKIINESEQQWLSEQLEAKGEVPLPPAEPIFSSAEHVSSATLSESSHAYRRSWIPLALLGVCLLILGVVMMTHGIDITPLLNGLGLPITTQEIGGILLGLTVIGATAISYWICDCRKPPQDHSTTQTRRHSVPPTKKLPQPEAKGQKRRKYSQELENALKEFEECRASFRPASSWCCCSTQ